MGGVYQECEEVYSGPLRSGPKFAQVELTMLNVLFNDEDICYWYELCLAQ